MSTLFMLASFILASASPTGAAQSGANATMLVSVSSTSAQYAIGNPVTLKFVLTNNGNSTIVMNGWLTPEMLLNLKITDANGIALALSGKPRHGYIPSLGTFKVLPGQATTMTAPLLDFGYAITKPGVYTIVPTLRQGYWEGFVYAYNSVENMLVTPTIQGVPQVTIQ